MHNNNLANKFKLSKGQRVYKRGDRITFNAPIPWKKDEYKIITDIVEQVYPNFLFTRKRHCVKPFDIKGHEGT